MASLNLNPDSYTNKELQKLLSLPNDYTHQDIIKHKQRLLHQLNRDDSNTMNSQEISIFIDIVSNRLTSQITSNIGKCKSIPRYS